MIPESTIEPLDMEALADVEVSDEQAADAIRTTAVIKLNGGLGTSMGMDRAKSLLCVRRGLSFLDIIARQVLHLRKTYDAPLPLIFMNSFRTSADTMAALARYDDLAGRGPAAGVPAEQGAQAAGRRPQPGVVPQGPRPRVVPARPRRPLHRAARHRPARPAHRAAATSGSSSPTPTTSAPCPTPGSPAGSPRRVRRSRSRRSAVRASDRKGGHFARRKSDGRIVLRETAQTLAGGQGGAGRPRPAPVLPRPTTCGSTSTRCATTLDRRGGILGLPLIRNVKTVDPADRSTPEVIQIETAMGAAIEVFEGARTIEVGRDRFVPVKTTNDLLVLRSDVYDLGHDFGLDQAADVPFVELDADYYKLVGEFDKRFPEGAPVAAQGQLAPGRGRLDLRARRAGRRRRGARGRVGPAHRGRHGARWLMAAELRQRRRAPAGSILDSAPSRCRRTTSRCSRPSACVAAEDVTAPIALPSFDNSAMDGYAVTYDDVADRHRRPPGAPAGRRRDRRRPGAAAGAVARAPPSRS